MIPSASASGFPAGTNSAIPLRVKAVAPPSGTAANMGRLAARRPILAAVPEGGATALTLNGIAELVPAGNPEALALGILRLRNDQGLLERLALDGKGFADRNLSLVSGRQRYLEWVDSFF